MLRTLLRSVTAAIVALAAIASEAADVPVAAKKLILKNSGNALVENERLAFFAVDPSVAMGAGTDPTQIGVRFRIMYGTWYGKSESSAPAGHPGWSLHGASAKFVSDEPKG